MTVGGVGINTAKHLTGCRPLFVPCGAWRHYMHLSPGESPSLFSLSPGLLPPETPQFAKPPRQSVSPQDQIVKLFAHFGQDSDLTVPVRCCQNRSHSVASVYPPKSSGFAKLIKASMPFVSSAPWINWRFKTN